MCLLASVAEGTYVYVVDEDIVLPVRAAGWRCSSRHETGVVAYRRLGHVPVLIQLMALRTRLCSRLMGLMSVAVGCSAREITSLVMYCMQAVVFLNRALL